MIKIMINDKCVINIEDKKEWVGIRDRCKLIKNQEIQKRIKSRTRKMTLRKAKRIYEDYSDNKFKVDGTFDTSKLSVKKIITSIKKDIFGKS